MALTLGRWMLIVAMSNAALLVFLSPTDPVFFTRGAPPPEANPARAAASHLAREIRELRSHQEMIAIEGDLIDAIAAAGTDLSPVVLADGNIEDLKLAIESSFESEWSALGNPSQARVGVYVRVTNNDSDDPLAPARPPSIQIQTLLPDGITRSSCLRIVSIPRTHGMLTEGWESDLRARLRVWGIDLGPCAAYAIFGVPGPTVRDWLARTNYRPISSMASTSAFGDFIARRAREGEPDIDTYSARALGCLAGKLTKCTDVFYAPGSNHTQGSRSTSRTTTLSDPRRFNRIAIYGWDFGGYEAYLVADMVGEFGTSRIQQFWMSSATLDQAFASATGTAPGRWIHRWAVQRVGPVKAGPTLDLRTGAAFVTLTGLSILSVLVRSLRRGGWRLRS